MTSRPAICYAAPGHRLLSSAGSTRNILATAEALSQWADVTVAFRSLAQSPPRGSFRLIEIEPRPMLCEARDDVAARGLDPLAHARYLRRLRRFAQASAGRYDLVLEKGWRLSGYLAQAFERSGTPAALIENDVRHWHEPVRGPRMLARRLAHLAAQRLAARCSRALPLVIAETAELQAALVAVRGLSAERIRVVPLGVDHRLFQPMSRSVARAKLGFSDEALIMLYVGGMDPYHDLTPLLCALADVASPGLALHLIGDGERRCEYERLARRARAPVRFEGTVDHRQVPFHIAAADLCIAPYGTDAFPGGQIYFSTLKVPEYMACARPVVSVPSGSIERLIEDGVSGFLLHNQAACWRRFLADMPQRARLEQMGRAAHARVQGLSWSATARGYLDAVIEAHRLPSLRTVSCRG